MVDFFKIFFTVIKKKVIMSSIKKDILLVEDNVTNQVLFKSIFDQKNWSYIITKNGIEALDSLQNYQFSLILMDLEMPLMNGIEAVNKIKSDDRYKHIPIIALSAHQKTNALNDLEKIGFNDFIEKPIEIAHFYEKVKQYINKET